MITSLERGPDVDALGYYIMIALLGAGAAYGLSNKGKPKPTVSSGQKKLLIACAVIIFACLLLLLATVLISQTSPPH